MDQPPHAHRWFDMNQRGFILPSPLMLVGGVALAFGISTLMFWRLYAATNAEYQTFRATVVAQQEAFESAQNRRLVAMAKENERNAKGWTAANAALARRPPVRVQSDCGARGLSSPASPGLRLDAAATQSGVGSTGATSPEVSVSQAEQIIEKGVKDAARVLWLQDYIESMREQYK